MTDGRDALILRLARLVQRGMTGAGHLAQLVPQEHRGNCTHLACTPACLEAGDLLRTVEPYLNPRPASPAGRDGRRGALPAARGRRRPGPAATSFGAGSGPRVRGKALRDGLWLASD